MIVEPTRTGPRAVPNPFDHTHLVAGLASRFDPPSYFDRNERIVGAEDHVRGRCHALVRMKVDGACLSPEVPPDALSFFLHPFAHHPGLVGAAKQRIGAPERDAADSAAEPRGGGNGGCTSHTRAQQPDGVAVRRESLREVLDRVHPGIERRVLKRSVRVAAPRLIEPEGREPRAAAFRARSTKYRDPPILLPLNP